MSLRGRRGLGLLLVGILTLAGAGPAAGQYFGRQKVLYEDFDWYEMLTPRFKIHFYEGEAEVTRDAARMAERWYQRLSRAFQHEFEQKPLIFYADHPDFQQQNVLSDLFDQSTGGVTEGLRTRVIMPFTGVYADNDHVLGHELVHVFQYDLAASPVGGGLMGLSRLPLWLMEGMAEYLSLGRVDAHTAMWMRDAALRGELPTIQQLTYDTRYFPYRYGQALWAFIAGKYGDRAVTEVFRLSTNVGFEEALVRVLGAGSNQLSQDWIASIRATYLPLITGRQRPQDVGRRVLYDPEPGAMHLSPSVSPDGSRVVYIGRRDLFTPDLILADAVTGKAIKTLSSPQRDQHMDAISYIQSSGSWSPDGERFAYVVVKGGDSRIEILNVRSTKVERNVDIEEIGAVSDPRWAPDGNRLVFSGSAGAQSDLFVYDLRAGTVDRLTNDRYADLQPVWSPDGRTIAFVTDRGHTDFERLVFGEMQLALYDLDTQQIRVLELFNDAKHIDPHYSPDGRSLFFISDRQGFSDIYRLDLQSEQVYQVTRLATGVSGITALSPAMSVATQANILMFSVFENSGNNIYSIDCSAACGEPVTREPQPMVASAAVLPPVEALGGGIVSAYLADADGGLPPVETEYPVQSYSPKISLEYLGPPSFGVGASDYGALLVGGVSAFFGDMLGNHFLGTAIQANGTLKDIGGQALYRNSSNRLTWGVTAGHIPYLTGFTAYRPLTETTYEITQFLDRIFVDQALGLMYYPFSTTRRIEFNAGVTRYSFDREVQRALFNVFGQQISPVERFDTLAPEPLTFFETSAAFVGDNSYWAFVGPVSGQRFRFEVSPTFGTLTYQTFLADYRRYVFKRPFTLAFRMLHYGRYGRDADGIAENNLQVLSPLFLGYETFVRGYARESIEVATECKPIDPTVSPCPVFDRLIGSRIAVANLEFRIPLIGVPEFGLLHFPFLPTEVSPFFDAGLAWSGNDDPRLSFETNSAARVPVFSAGISARFNVLGFLVMEAYYAYPFQRPDKGGHFGFNLAPAW